MDPSYQEDLAYIHHVGFADFASGAAPGILAMLHSAGIDHGLVVDLGCGSGELAATLTQAGYSVLGVDHSAAMVALARSVAPQASFVENSLHEVELPRCRAVTALGESLCYLPADAPGQRMEDLFARVAEALHPGGLFVFDVVLRARGRPMRYRAWRTGDDWAVLVEVTEDAGRAQLTRDITTFRKVGSGYRRAQETHVQRLYTRGEIEHALRQAGFSVRTHLRYGAHSLPRQRLAFSARLPVAARDRLGARAPADPSPS